MSSIPAQDVDSGQPLIFLFNFREVSLQMSFTQMWIGAMWTSQTLVTTPSFPYQGLVGSGPVRRVVPMGKRSRWTRKQVIHPDASLIALHVL